MSDLKVKKKSFIDEKRIDFSISLIILGPQNTKKKINQNVNAKMLKISNL